MDNVLKVQVILREVEVMALTTIDGDGRLLSRPMALHTDRFDGVLRFIAHRNASCVRHVAHNATASATFSSPSMSVAAHGAAKLVRDTAAIARQWHPGLEKWIPGGPEDAVLIALDADVTRTWTPRRGPDFAAPRTGAA